MLRLSAAVHKKGMSFDAKMKRILFCHPYFDMLFVGIAAPTMVLAAVALCTCLLALTAGLVFGWL